MGRSFDELLQEGKSRVAETPAVDKNQRWKECINSIMNTLHELNAIYDGENSVNHYIDIGKVNCKKCMKASFLVVAKDLGKPKRSIRFHQSQWKSVERGSYFCDQCRP